MNHYTIFMSQLKKEIKNNNKNHYYCNINSLRSTEIGCMKAMTRR